MYTFTTSRIGLAAMQESDLPQFIDVYASNTYYLSFFEADATIDLERMQKEWQEDSALPGWHAVGFFRLEDRRPIGFIYFVERHPRLGIPHIGLFVIDQRLHGQGYGTEALDGFLNHMRTTQDWRTVRIGVIADNRPAVKFWTGRGFTHSGESHMALLRGPAKILHMTRELETKG